MLAARSAPKDDRGHPNKPPNPTSAILVHPRVGIHLGEQVRKCDNAQCDKCARAKMPLRRGGRAADRTGLENRSRGNSTEGSNPSPSAVQTDAVSRAGLLVRGFSIRDCQTS